MNTALAALVNGVLSGTLIVIGVWLVLRLMPLRMLNAATRYVIWWFVLAFVITLPVSYLPVQWIHRGRLSNRARITEPGLAGAVQPVDTAYSPERPRVLEREVAIAPVPLAPRLPMAGDAPLRKPPYVWPSFPIQIIDTRWPSWVIFTWVAVSLILLARLAVSYVLLRRVCARAANVPALVYARAEKWAAVCGASRRGIRLASSAEIAVPVAVGPRRPSILIPASLLDQLEDDDLDQLGLHETAHLARRDDYALLVQRALEALFALHPVVRWIARQIDLEREIACDDLVIAATGRPRSYATCLTRIAELSGGLRSSLVAATAAEDSSHLARRVDMLLDKTRHTGTHMLKGRLGATVAVVAVAAWFAGKCPPVVAFPKPLERLAVQWPTRMLPMLPMLPQAAEVTQPHGQELAGEVVEDSSGSPLASAELRFHQQGMRELAADLESDRQGRFRATELPSGDYTVDLSKPNYITTTFKLRVPATGVRLRLVRFGVIDGEATNAAGHPIPGRVLAPTGRTLGSARVTVLVKAPGTEALHSFRETPIEEDGRYRVYDLPPGEYAVGLWYSGLNEGSGMQLYPDNVHARFFTVSGGEEYSNINFTIEARESHRVSGKIELPASKARFQLALGLPEQPMLPIAQTLTEDDGTFRFEKVPSGTYDLFAAGPTSGYTAFESILGRGEPLFGRTRIQVSAQDLEGVNVPLSAGRSVAVVLRPRSSDKPPEGCPQTAAVSLVSLEPWAVMFMTNAQISFDKEQTIRNLAPGRFRLAATGLGSACYQVNQPVVDLSANVTNPVAVELAAAGSIRGLLKAGSARTTDFVVILLDADNADGAQAQLAFPDNEGRFGFVGLRPGRYRIAVQAVGEARARWIADVSGMVEIDVPGGPPTSLELPVEAKGGRP